MERRRTVPTLTMRPSAIILTSLTLLVACLIAERFTGAGTPLRPLVLAIPAVAFALLGLLPMTLRLDRHIGGAEGLSPWALACLLAGAMLGVAQAFAGGGIGAPAILAASATGLMIVHIGVPPLATGETAATVADAFAERFRSRLLGAVLGLTGFGLALTLSVPVAGLAIRLVQAETGIGAGAASALVAGLGLCTVLVSGVAGLGMAAGILLPFAVLLAAAPLLSLLARRGFGASLDAVHSAASALTTLQPFPDDLLSSTSLVIACAGAVTLLVPRASANRKGGTVPAAPLAVLIGLGLAFLVTAFPLPANRNLLPATIIDTGAILAPLGAVLIFAALTHAAATSLTHDVIARLLIHRSTQSGQLALHRLVLTVLVLAATGFGGNAVPQFARHLPEVLFVASAFVLPLGLLARIPATQRASLIAVAITATCTGLAVLWGDLARDLAIAVGFGVSLVLGWLVTKMRLPQ